MKKRQIAKFATENPHLLSTHSRAKRKLDIDGHVDETTPSDEEDARLLNTSSDLMELDMLEESRAPSSDLDVREGELPGLTMSPVSAEVSSVALDTSVHTHNEEEIAFKLGPLLAPAKAAGHTIAASDQGKSGVTFEMLYDEINALRKERDEARQERDHGLALLNTIKLSSQTVAENDEKCKFYTGLS